jgi:hypothetical protein
MTIRGTVLTFVMTALPAATSARAQALGFASMSMGTCSCRSGRTAERWPARAAGTVLI